MLSVRGGTTIRNLFTVAAAAWLAIRAAPARAETITVTYEAKAKTIVKQPFGLSIPFDSTVTGYFTCDTDTEDLAPGDALSGAYQHEAGAAFLAEVLSTRITGSSTPFYQVDLDADPTLDTFRFVDGPRTVGNEGGVMSIDEIADDQVQLSLSITEDAFDSDELINPFPAYTLGFLGTSHTFRLSDDRGTMLIQFVRAGEAVCGDPGGGGVTAGSNTMQ